MRLIAAICTLLFCSTAVLAQGVPSGPVAFPQVTAAPIPLQSASGRFSSLNPLDQRNCSYKRVAGRVVSPRLIMVKQMNCGLPGHENVLVNVRLSNPADAAKMIAGRQVVIAASFKSAHEFRDALFDAEFLMAENARLVDDPRERSTAPPQTFTSYMLCQPPELDALSVKLGRDLCVQSTLIANLPAAEPALEMAARSPAKVSPQEAVPGGPDAITCRLDPGISDRQLPAIACARGSYWAWYQAKWPEPWSSTPAPP